MITIISCIALVWHLRLTRVFYDPASAWVFFSQKNKTSFFISSLRDTHPVFSCIKVIGQADE
jgi:hypothetical protein